MKLRPASSVKFNLHCVKVMYYARYDHANVFFNFRRSILSVQEILRHTSIPPENGKWANQILNELSHSQAIYADWSKIKK